MERSSCQRPRANMLRFGSLPATINRGQSEKDSATVSFSYLASLARNIHRSLLTFGLRCQSWEDVDRSVLVSISQRTAIVDVFHTQVEVVIHS